MYQNPPPAARPSREPVYIREWEFHNAMLGAKMQVTAQFGDDSDEVQAIGLKKKSEYKAPTRRKQSARPTN